MGDAMEPGSQFLPPDGADPTGEVLALVTFAVPAELAVSDAEHAQGRIAVSWVSMEAKVRALCTDPGTCAGCGATVVACSMSGAPMGALAPGDDEASRPRVPGGWWNPPRVTSLAEAFPGDDWQGAPERVLLILHHDPAECEQHRRTGREASS